MGVSPEESMESAQLEMENCLAELSHHDEWLCENPVHIEWFGARWLPGTIKNDHPLQSVLFECFEKIRREKPVIEASPWGTDGGILSNIAGVPVIVFGPGTTSAAHDANEYIILEEMFQASEIIALTLIKWCELSC